MDDREAMAIAAQGRCLVLTCPATNCEINGKSGGPMRMFYARGDEVGSLAGVRVVEIPTKAPAGMVVMDNEEEEEEVEVIAIEYWN